MKTNLFSRILSATAFVAILSTSSSVFAQVKVGSNPSTIGTTSNLEVEATNGNKTIVNKTTGQVTIQDGTQGAGKILTSDANGNASWQSSAEANIPQLILRAYSPGTTQPTSTTSYAPSVPFVSGDGSNYNPSGGTFTAPVAGFYEYSVSMLVTGPGGSVFTVQTTMDIEDGNIRGGSQTVNFTNPRSQTGIKYLEAGETLNFFVYIGGGQSFNSNWKLSRISVLVYKR